MGTPTATFSLVDVVEIGNRQFGHEGGWDCCWEEARWELRQKEWNKWPHSKDTKVGGGVPSSTPDRGPRHIEHVVSRYWGGGGSVPTAVPMTTGMSLVESLVEEEFSEIMK